MGKAGEGAAICCLPFVGVTGGLVKGAGCLSGNGKGAGIIAGKPRVFLGTPSPHPSKPVPATRVRVTRMWGCGLSGVPTRTRVWLRKSCIHYIYIINKLYTLKIYTTIENEHAYAR